MAWVTPPVFVVSQVVTAAVMNTMSADLSYLAPDNFWSGWSWTNSWVDLGTTPSAACRLIGTRVVLRGAMKSGTINLPAFTLPVGYRPTGNVNFACTSNYLIGSLGILATGVVTPNAGSNVWFSLDGISFDTLA